MKVPEGLRITYDTMLEQDNGRISGLFRVYDGERELSSLSHYLDDCPTGMVMEKLNADLSAMYEDYDGDKVQVYYNDTEAA